MESEPSSVSGVGGVGGKDVLVPAGWLTLTRETS